MKIAFFGTPQEVTPVLDTLVQQFDVALVITTPDQPVGRKRTLTPPPVKITAQKHTIPVIQPKKLDETANQQIRDANIELFITASYGKIIPQHILSLPKYGAINVHPSLLPKYRGPTPIQTALLKQEKKSGITFLLMDQQIDHGPILLQIPYAIHDSDTFASLMNDMFLKSASILPDVIIKFINGDITPVKQNESSATFTQSISKNDGYLEMQKLPDKTQINAMIHAYYPWPGVWTKVTINDKELRIKLLPQKRLQIEGKSPVSIKDFVNGYPALKEFVEKVY